MHVDLPCHGYLLTDCSLIGMLSSEQLCQQALRSRALEQERLAVFSLQPSHCMLRAFRATFVPSVLQNVSLRDAWTRDVINEAKIECVVRGVEQVQLLLKVCG